ncbi:MAG: hypothetical protein AABZ55_10505 [Bdellovibrionota bacterium]
MNLSVFEVLALLSGLAGVVHLFAPDHWVPAAVLAWQRNWGLFKVLGFSIRLIFFHVGTAFVLFWLFQGLLLKTSPHNLMAVAVLMIAAGGIIRTLRFSRLSSVLRLGPSPSGWGIYSVIALIGPSESLIPILIKSHQMGVGYLLPVGTFAAGSVLSVFVLIRIGREIWDRPLLLPLGIQWANQRFSILPAAVSVIAGLAFLLKV